MVQPRADSSQEWMEQIFQKDRKSMGLLEDVPSGQHWTSVFNLVRRKTPFSCYVSTFPWVKDAELTTFSDLPGLGGTPVTDKSSEDDAGEEGQWRAQRTMHHGWSGLRSLVSAYKQTWRSDIHCARCAPTDQYLLYPLKQIRQASTHQLWSPLPRRYRSIQERY